MLIGMFDDIETAQGALHDLIDNDFSTDHVSVVAVSAAGQCRFLDAEGRYEVVTPSEGAAAGASVGATFGSLGGLLVGVGMLFIPGIGPALAVGPLITALVGAGIGAAGGGIAGALTNRGVSDEEAEYYAEGIRRGCALVTVDLQEGEHDKATTILQSHQPIDIQERARAWREHGWKGFDPKADAYSPDEIVAERERYVARQTR